MGQGLPIHLIFAALGATALLAAGLGLLIAGLRGRRLDDHPVCRRCRFDLVGLVPGATVCPECAADLTPAGATRSGNRRRRPGLILAAALHIVLGTSLGGAVVWAHRTGFDVNPLKPTSLLVYEAGSSRPSVAGPAVAELRRRLLADDLGDSRLHTAVEHALARHSDRSTPPLGEDLSLIESALVKGRLAAEHATRFAQQAIAMRLVARERINPAGDESFLAAMIVVDPARCAAETGLRVEATIVGATLGDRPYTVLFPGPISATISPHTRGRSYLRGRSDAPAGDGKLVMHLRITVRPPQSVETTLGQFDMTLEADTRVVATDAEVLRLMTDEPGGAPAAARVRMEELAATHSPNLDEVLLGSPVVSDLRADLVCTVTLRDGERLWELPSVLHVPRAGGASDATGDDRIFAQMPEGFDAARVDVFLRPAPGAAMVNTLAAAIWGEEIVLLDVPVDWSVLETLRRRRAVESVGE